MRTFQKVISNSSNIIVIIIGFILLPGFVASMKFSKLIASVLLTLLVSWARTCEGKLSEFVNSYDGEVNFECPVGKYNILAILTIEVKTY